MKSSCVTTLLVLCSVLWMGVTADITTGNPGTIYLDNGMYKGVLVAVDQAAEFHENVIPNLKAYFSQASDVLYEATKMVSGRRFSDITILLPRSWPHLQQCQSVSIENQNAANFIVEKDTEQWLSNPHTLKIDSQCGTPGKTTYLPRSFVIDESEAKKYGENIGKTLIHEWGHNRYGLFDELEEVLNPTTCLLFENGDMHPIKCSTEVTGDLYKSDDGQSCSFQAHLNQPQHVKGSLMYLPYLDTVTTFCNKTGSGITHNSGVENPQNDRCNGRSAWEVMMEHPDFKTHTASASSAPEQDVQFRCVQERDVERMVLVMDVSGSMQEEHRIQRMQQDVNVFLKSMPCRDTSIGMVEFSSNMEETRIIHPMARLNVGENLASLISAIPGVTREHTCIGCGILRAIELVKSSNRTVNGTVLAVFSDGQENQAPYINEVVNEVLSNGIVVYSIMLMSQARDHPLIKLSTQTGGKSCIFSDSQHTTYYDCLNGILHHRSPLTAPNQILSELIEIGYRQTHLGHLVIDADLAEHVGFVLTWSTHYLGGCEDTIIRLTSPGGRVITSADTDIYEYKYNLRTITIDVSGYGSGNWTFNLTNTDHYLECVVRVMVEARQLLDDCSSGGPPSEMQLPVLIFPTIDSQKVVLHEDNDPLDNAIKLYTEVRKGPYAVIDAIVNANIQNENGDQWTVPLYDNGRGADAVRNDGVYSSYYTGFNKDGTYTATFQVIGTNNTKILVKSDELRQSGAPKLPQFKANAIPGTTYRKIEEFQRVQVAGFFEVVNYTQAANESGVNVVQTWFPPPQIVDLKVLYANQNTGAITITWTAVGNRLDHGTASSYEIRASTSADILRNSFNTSYLIQSNEVLSGDTNSAKHSGETELFIIKPNPDTFVKNKLYYLAVKTVNSYNKKSPVSNVVLFQHLSIVVTTTMHNPPISTTTERTTKLPSISTTKASTPRHDRTTTASSDDKTSPFPTWIYYIIAGLGGGLLLTMLILCMVCCSKYTSRKTEGDRSDEVPLPQTFIGLDGMTTANPDGVCIEVDGGGGSDQEPDLIKEIHDKDLDGLSSKYGQHSTWPAANKYNARRKKDKKKRSSNIFISIGRSHLITGIRKKLGAGKSNEKLDKEWSSKPGGSNVPLQDQAYSNPLFGRQVMVPEIDMHNTVIIQSRPPSPKPNFRF